MRKQLFALLITGLVLSGINSGSLTDVKASFEAAPAASIQQLARATSEVAVETTVEAPAEESATTESISAVHGNRIVHVPSGSVGGFTWNGSDATTTEAYVQMLSDELAKYEAGEMQRYGVSTIKLVHDLKSPQGAAVLGLADPVNQVMYLNAHNDRAEEPLVRSVVHHELAHVALWTMFGHDSLSYAPWAAIDSGEAVERPDYFFPAPGYVNRYAMTSLAEDMAETYAFMMTDEYKTRLDAQVQIDSVLADKVTLLSELFEG